LSLRGYTRQAGSYRDAAASSKLPINRTVAMKAKERGGGGRETVEGKKVHELMVVSWPLDLQLASSLHLVALHA